MIWRILFAICVPFVWLAAKLRQKCEQLEYEEMLKNAVEASTCVHLATILFSLNVEDADGVLDKLFAKQEIHDIESLQSARYDVECFALDEWVFDFEGNTKGIIFYVR